MQAGGVDAAAWSSLLHSTQDLVTQDHHSFPRVDRNILQLQQYAESLRARTNKFRSLDNQIAATRLLAQQGFDASRSGPGSLFSSQGCRLSPHSCRSALRALRRWTNMEDR